MNKQRGFAPILIIILIALGIGGYLLYQKQTTPTSVSQPSPSPVSSPVASNSAETANWKTYTNTENNFTLKYPKSWVYKEGIEGPEFAPSNNLFSVANSGVFSPISVLIKSRDNFDLSSTSLNQYEEKPIIISGISAKRVTGTHKSDGTRFTGVKFNDNNKIFVIITLGDNYIQTFDQILSTFKFTQ